MDHKALRRKMGELRDRCRSHERHIELITAAAQAGLRMNMLHERSVNSARWLAWKILRVLARKLKVKRNREEYVPKYPGLFGKRTYIHDFIERRKEQ